MKLRLLVLLNILLSCGGPSELVNRSNLSNKSLIGQWSTKDHGTPHWLMFDSTSNYYRWAINQDIPELPLAQFSVKEDSILVLNFFEMDDLPSSEGNSIEMIIEIINSDSLRMSPAQGEMPIFEYVRDTFDNPQYLDITFFYLSPNEADSLVNTNKKVIELYESCMENLKELSSELEYSIANTNFTSSKIIFTRDSTSYNKFDYGGFGIVYYRNDSVYVRAGIPSLSEFFEEANSFFIHPIIQTNIEP